MAAVKSIKSVRCHRLSHAQDADCHFCIAFFSLRTTLYSSYTILLCTYFHRIFRLAHFLSRSRFYAFPQLPKNNLRNSHVYANVKFHVQIYVIFTVNFNNYFVKSFYVYVNFFGEIHVNVMWILRERNLLRTIFLWIFYVSFHVYVAGYVKV